MEKSEAGKGDGNRTKDKAAFDESYERIYGVDVRIPPPDNPDYQRLLDDICQCIRRVVSRGGFVSESANTIVKTLVTNWRKS